MKIPQDILDKAKKTIDCWDIVAEIKNERIPEWMKKVCESNQHSYHSLPVKELDRITITASKAVFHENEEGWIDFHVYKDDFSEHNKPAYILSVQEEDVLDIRLVQKKYSHAVLEDDIIRKANEIRYSYERKPVAILMNRQTWLETHNRHYRESIGYGDIDITKKNESMTFMGYPVIITPHIDDWMFLEDVTVEMALEEMAKKSGIKR